MHNEDDVVPAGVNLCGERAYCSGATATCQCTGYGDVLAVVIRLGQYYLPKRDSFQCDPYYHIDGRRKVSTD